MSAVLDFLAFAAELAAPFVFVVAVGGTLVLLFDELARRWGPALERWWKQ